MDFEDWKTERRRMRGEDIPQSDQFSGLSRVGSNVVASSSQKQSVQYFTVTVSQVFLEPFPARPA